MAFSIQADFPGNNGSETRLIPQVSLEYSHALDSAFLSIQYHLLPTPVLTIPSSEMTNNTRTREGWNSVRQKKKKKDQLKLHPVL